MRPFPFAILSVARNNASSIVSEHVCKHLFIEKNDIHRPNVTALWKQQPFQQYFMLHPCCLLLFVLMHPFVNFLLYIIILTYTYLICLPSWEFVLWKFPFFCPPLTHFCVSVYKKKANCNFLLLSSLPLFIYIWILLFFCQYKGGLEPCAQLLTHRMSLMENIY